MMKTTLALALVAATLGGCASLDYDDGYGRFGYSNDGYYRNRDYGDRYYWRDRGARDRYDERRDWRDDDRGAYRYRGDVYYDRPYYGSFGYRNFDRGQ
jgi:hypothetical protein